MVFFSFLDLGNLNSIFRCQLVTWKEHLKGIQVLNQQLTGFLKSSWTPWKYKVWSTEIRVLVSLVLWTIPVYDCFAFSYLNGFENWLLETLLKVSNCTGCRVQEKAFSLQEDPLSSTQLYWRLESELRRWETKLTLQQHFLPLFPLSTLVYFPQHWKERMENEVAVSITWLFIPKIW